MRRLSRKLKLERSRGDNFYNGSVGARTKLQFRDSLRDRCKNHSGSRFLGFNFLLSLLCILPFILFFSYYPIISLGSDGTMNFELSLPILWLIVFDVVGAVVLVREGLVLGALRKWKYLLFPVFVTLSVLWSFNMVRGILTVGVMWLVVIAVILIVQLKLVFNKEFLRKFLKWFFGATLAVCAWCFIQCILDVAGVGREYTLMCAGCTYQSFGFPHPNGFAIEPQFMGNLLLAPAVVSAWLILVKQKNKNHSGSDFLGSIFLFPCFFVIAATLFLTFSRGAIYAFVVAMIFMMAWVGVRQKSWKVLKMLGIVALAFLFTLNLQGILAQVSPTNDTYQSGVAKALNHLSLGIIDIRQKEELVIDNNGVMSDDVEDLNESDFDGYVEESTEVRKMLTRSALKLWSRDFWTAMFGVGIGGAGQAMYGVGLTDSPKEIVQNEYASVLLETGLVGVGLAVVLVMMVIFAVTRNRNGEMILTLMVAYGVSLMFFAGLPNALQIYLLPAVFWAVFYNKNGIGTSILKKDVL